MPSTAVGHPHVECLVHCAEDVRYVQVRRRAMEHALLNLFVNACQAMQGQGVLTVRVVQNPAGDCHLDVEDTGPGIEPKHLEHIFKPFYSTQNTGQGSGLGLALVDRVIREHDGHIEVDTEVGRGAIFHLTLPARVVVSHTDQDPS